MSYRFLLHISYAYGIPIGKPLEAEILRRGYEVRWFAEENETRKYFSDTENVLNTAQAVIEYNPHIVLCASNTVPDFFPGIKVQVFHGIDFDKRGNSKKGHFRIRGLYDLYCTHGPTNTIPFRYLTQHLKYCKIVETGWAKLDLLFPVSKVPNIKPVIFLASTFTKNMSLAHDKDVYEEIRRLVKYDKWDWIINLHPKMDKEIVKKFKALQGNITYIDVLNDLEPLKKADVMLCDTSSITTEFIVQNKPVVTYKNKNPGKHLINIVNPSEIEATLEYALKRPEYLMNEIQKFIQITHPYSDGKSSGRVLDASIDFYENKEKYVSGKKPLNLFRKIQCRLKFRFFMKSFI